MIPTNPAEMRFANLLNDTTPLWPELPVYHVAPNRSLKIGDYLVKIYDPKEADQQLSKPEPEQKEHSAAHIKLVPLPLLEIEGLREHVFTFLDIEGRGSLARTSRSLQVAIDSYFMMNIKEDVKLQRNKTARILHSCMSLNPSVSLSFREKELVLSALKKMLSGLHYHVISYTSRGIKKNFIPEDQRASIVANSNKQIYYFINRCQVRYTELKDLERTLSMGLLAYRMRHGFQNLIFWPTSHQRGTDLVLRRR